MSEKQYGHIVGLNTNGDGLEVTSAELQIRFQEEGGAPKSLRLGAGAASQYFAAVCSLALYAYERQCVVTITVADDDPARLTYLGLPLKDHVVGKTSGEQPA